MVLVMESDGSRTPAQSQKSFARNYNDGIGQGSAADELAIFGSDETMPEREAMRFAARVGPAPLPRADVLNAIETTALRYASHPGLRRAELSVTDWLSLYRANIEVESAYRQDAISHAGAIGLGQLMPDTARDLGVDGRVHFLGNVPHADIPLHVRAADAFVLNSEYEGLSHTLLEVQALGTPIVASGVCGNPEVVEDDVNGLLVAPRAPATLVAALRRVLDDPALGERYVAAGHDRAARFDRETTFSRVEQILSDPRARD